MKNKKDVIDLLHNADDSTIEKIVSSDPQYDRKKADRLYKQIERRVEGIDGDFTGGEVSGVEHYRPQTLRRVASVAACVALVGAGVGTVYGLSRSAPDSSKNIQASVTTGTSAAGTSNATTKNSVLPTKEYSKSELTQESLYERMLDPLSHFDKCYIVYNSVSEDSSCKIAVSQSEGIYSMELSQVWDYSYKDKRISIPNNPNDKVIVENPSENLKKRLLNKDSITNSYGDFSQWKITGTDNYLGRECAVIEINDDDTDNIYLVHVDLQTGIVLRLEVPTMGDEMIFTNVTEVYFDDDAASHIPSPAEVGEFIENGDYELEDGLTLDFLSEKSYETTTETTAETTTTETTAAAETTVTTPENTKSAATTTLETTIENGEPVTIPDMHIFEALDGLPYHATSCDGVPTHTLKGPDGTIYHLNLDNTSSYHYVWRRPSLVDDPDNEAPLTDEIVDYILSHMDELPIVPFSWI